jgi:4-amino-4-deoxy-L-arabinose transferase-like glycosyltransferase
VAIVSSIPRRPLPRVSAPLDLWLLAGAALWLLGVGYGLRDPWPADEPRFALIGRDIIETGRWFIPHRGPEVYAEKPPVFLWLQALAYALTGSTRMGFLLPSLLAALGTLGLTWDLARRLYGRQIAFWAGMALLLTVQFVLHWCENFSIRRGQRARPERFSGNRRHGGSDGHEQAP